LQNNRLVGALYEEKAADYLKSIGYSLVERNYHAGKTSEIDIIAKDENTLVFVECKFRKNRLSGDPYEAVNYAKIKNICKCAMVYMKKNNIPTSHPVRFDVIAMYGDESINHLKNAFEFINPYERY